MRERRKRRTVPREEPPGGARELHRGSRLAQTRAEQPSRDQGRGQRQHLPCPRRGAAHPAPPPRAALNGTCEPPNDPRERGARGETPPPPPQGSPDPRPSFQQGFLWEMRPRRDPPRPGGSSAPRGHPGPPPVPGAAGPGSPPSARRCGAGAVLWALAAPPGRCQPVPPARRRGGAAAGALSAGTPRLLLFPERHQVPRAGHKRRQPPSSPPGRQDSPEPPWLPSALSPAQRRSLDSAFRSPLLFLMQEFLPSF